MLHYANSKLFAKPLNARGNYFAHYFSDNNYPPFSHQFFLFADCPSVKAVIPFALFTGFYVQSFSELWLFFRSISSADAFLVTAKKNVAWNKLRTSALKWHFHCSLILTRKQFFFLLLVNIPRFSKFPVLEIPRFSKFPDSPFPVLNLASSLCEG